MKSVDFILVALLATSCLPAGAQSYHYGYGGSRVVNQGQTGLSNPSGTYIGAGTMSQSARGLPAGNSSGGMSGLPATKMGATVGTPGDNQYNPTVMDERLHGRRSRMPVSRMGAYVGQPGDNMRSDLHYYTPGQNGGALRQGNFVAPRARGGYTSGGSAATYAETENYNVNNNGAFHY